MLARGGSFKNSPSYVNPATASGVTPVQAHNPFKRTDSRIRRSITQASSAVRWGEPTTAPANATDSAATENASGSGSGSGGGGGGVDAKTASPRSILKQPSLNGQPPLLTAMSSMGGGGASSSDGDDHELNADSWTVDLVMKEAGVSHDALELRKRIRHHPMVVKELDRFWAVFKKAKLPSTDPTLRNYGLHLGGIIKPEFVQSSLLISRALLPKSFDPNQSQSVASKDWDEWMSVAIGGKAHVGIDAMNRHLYMNYLFELTDFWCMKTEIDHYVQFLRVLCSAVTTTDSKRKKWAALTKSGTIHFVTDAWKKRASAAPAEGAPPGAVAAPTIPNGAGTPNGSGPADWFHPNECQLESKHYINLGTLVCQIRCLLLCVSCVFDVTRLMLV